MKKFLIIFIFGFLAFSFNSYSQLKVDSNGNTTVKYGNFSPGNDAILYLGDTNHYIKSVHGWGVKIGTAGSPDVLRIKQYAIKVGIGRDPLYTLDVNGTIRANTTLYSSDKRFKRNIESIENPIRKIKQIEGVSYRFIKEDNASEKDNEQSDKNKNFGFIAQDFQIIYPELVYEDSLGYLSIDYVSMIPVLIEAIKEQQKTIENLTAQIETIENDCCNNNLKSGTIDRDNGLSADENQAKLYQNTPNPFNNQTTIRFNIPKTVQSAQLYICNMTGTLLKTITINQRGTGQEIISANEFNAGMYLYSLVTDGKIVDTKQMLLTN